MKIVASLAATAALGVMLMPALSTPARAAGCYYKAVNLEGRVLDIRGVGHAAKLEWACNRARRECNRRLERAYRRGELPRGVVCRRGASS
jgi:hypothetical protein